jgi:hypothetical protein
MTEDPSSPVGFAAAGRRQKTDDRKQIHHGKTRNITENVIKEKAHKRIRYTGFATDG